jgi:phosphate transport system protein
MSPREQLDRKIADVRLSVIALGQHVDEQLKHALKALNTLDVQLAKQVQAADQHINAERYSIEDTCIKVIVTEQPAARDLRTIIGALNIIVDLERIGDKAKDIAATVPDVLKSPDWPRPPEIKQLGNLTGVMLRESMQGYADGNIELAKQVAAHYREIHPLVVKVLSQTIEHMAEVKKEKKVTATYSILQVAQHLDRVGDHTTNIAERVIYIATGSLSEMNVPLPKGSGSSTDQ